MQYLYMSMALSASILYFIIVVFSPLETIPVGAHVVFHDDNKVNVHCQAQFDLSVGEELKKVDQFVSLELNDILRNVSTETNGYKDNCMAYVGLARLEPPPEDKCSIL